MEDKLAEMQEKCNELFKKDGLTDEVLDLQIKINQLRYKHDITDKEKVIHKTYVQ